MSKKFNFTRYQCPANFSPYVLSYYRERHDADVTKADGLAMFSVQIVGKAFAITAIVWSCDGFFNRVGQKWRALIGGIVSSFAIFLGWLSMVTFSSYFVFLLLEAAMVGVGTGIAYTAPLVILQKWMPQAPGLAFGMVIAGFAVGGTVFGALEFYWVNVDNAEPNDDTGLFDSPDMLDRVPSLFLLEAGVTLCMHLVGFLLLSEKKQEASLLLPDSRRRSSLRVSRIESLAEKSEAQSMSPMAMMRHPNYWCMAAIFFTIGMPCSFLQGAMKEIGSDANFSDQQVTIVICLASVSNGLFRPLWGWAHDFFRTKPVLVVLGVCFGIFFCFWSLVMDKYATFIIWSLILNAHACAPFVILPAATLRYFGPRYFGVNYGFMFAIYAATALIVSIINPTDFWQDISITFRLIILGVASALAAIPTLFLRETTISLGEDKIALVDSDDEHEEEEDIRKDVTASTRPAIGDSNSNCSSPLAIPIDLNLSSHFQMRYGAVDDAECPTSASTLDHASSVERLRSPPEASDP